jgi:hypothetical protein
MKKLLLPLFALTFVLTDAQITVTSAVVPLFMQGNSTTNNNRVAIYFWADISGLTPGATYRYYTSMDTLNSSPTSNGAGNPYLINRASGTVRRTTNPSLVNAAGHDSIQANNAGAYSGWFAVEPTGNGRYTPGRQVHPQIQFNNGAGGTSVATRLKFTSLLVDVINFGTTSGSPLQGSALYDTSVSPSKSFAVLFDNQTGSGRPISIGIVEDDGNDLFAVTSIANFYRTLVDTIGQSWGVIIPNNLPNGIQRVEYRDFLAGQMLLSMVDDNGIWCSLTNTINPANGTTGVMLDEWFSLAGNGSANLDTAQVLQNITFAGTSNDVNATYTWNFGDNSPTSNSNPVIHNYTAGGWYYYSLTINNGECYQIITDSIYIEGTVGQSDLSANIIASVYPNPAADYIQLNFGNNANLQIEIFDALGNLTHAQSNIENQVRLDVSALSEGFYFVKITDAATKQIGVAKFLKH